jgi:opacity protein-like surface antigen
MNAGISFLREITMKKALVFSVMIFCLPLAAMAEDYAKAEIFGGFSVFSGSLAGDYNEIASMLGTAQGNISIPPGWRLEGSLLRGDNREQFYGFQTSVAGNFHKNAGIVVDFGYQYNHLDDQRFDVCELLFGPQLNMRGNRANVFAHALFGTNGYRFGGSQSFVDFSGSDHFSENAFAMGFGGGVDVNAGDRFAVRVVQFDWIPNRIGREWSTSELRLGFGIVVKVRK